MKDEMALPLKNQVQVRIFSSMTDHEIIMAITGLVCVMCMAFWFMKTVQRSKTAKLIIVFAVDSSVLVVVLSVNGVPLIMDVDFDSAQPTKQPERSRRRNTGTLSFWICYQRYAPLVAFITEQLWADGLSKKVQLAHYIILTVAYIKRKTGELFLVVSDITTLKYMQRLQNYVSREIPKWPSKTLSKHLEQ